VIERQLRFRVPCRGTYVWCKLNREFSLYFTVHMFACDDARCGLCEMVHSKLNINLTYSHFNPREYEKFIA
jgi:hypothetical protein